MKRILSFMIFGACLGFCVAQPFNQLPMYGGQHEPTVEPNAAHSKDAAARGWKAYYGGDLETAIMRFNQAWLFDQSNPEAYWGFGLIEGQRAREEAPEKRLRASIRFLQMAAELDSENGKILGDLAYSHTLLGRHFQVHGHAFAQLFETALQLFNSASELSPEYPPVWATWSVCLFYSGNFAEAKLKADQATSLGYRFGADYLQELDAKLTEASR
ncbi:MAG: hypothetical protein HRT56_00740 [Coraliomargarita sp.]|nr:hypothetical protein [Coraliomargarita sp.]